LVARWVASTSHLSATTLYQHSTIADMEALTPEAAS
jgi:hypothetical protein